MAVVLSVSSSAALGAMNFLLDGEQANKTIELHKSLDVLLQRLRAPVIYAKKDLRVGASIGIAFINGRKEPPSGRRSSMPISP